jgi:hypothetical protein
LACKGVPFVAHDDCRERFGCHACDFRRDVSDSRLDFPHVNYDFVKDDADPKRGAEAFDGALSWPSSSWSLVVVMVVLVAAIFIVIVAGVVAVVVVVVVVAAVVVVIVVVVLVFVSVRV